MFRVILRTPEEKADLEASWRRPDHEFFSAGACHVLAGVFLEEFPSAGFHALMIQPAEGFQGGHVLVADDRIAFDARGWCVREQYLQVYSETFRELFPGWEYSLRNVADPIGWDFCRTHGHRHPSQFLRDPIPRAKAFREQFPPPDVGRFDVGRGPTA